MGFKAKEELEAAEQQIQWKYIPNVKKKKSLPKFFHKPVTLKKGIYYFDFLNMEYDPEENDLIVKDSYIPLDSKKKFKNAKTEEKFEMLNDTKYPTDKILIKFKRYMKEVQKNNAENTTNKIYTLVEIKRVQANNNELIQAVKDLLLDAGLKKTHNKYVMPLTNNICHTITRDEILQFIYDVTGIRALSTSTLDAALSYFNKEYDPSYHKIATKNGYFDFETLEFHESSKEEIIINKSSPYNYNSELIGFDNCPIKLKTFLEETFQDDLSKIDQLLEIFGYYLDDGNPYQILVTFIGASRSGKGTCATLLRLLVGKNTCKVDIFTVDFQSKYSQKLITSDINFVHEVKQIKNFAEVKDYTGGDGLELAKIYEETALCEDIQLPKTIVTTNNYNNIRKELDHALIERMRTVIEFINGRTFEERDGNLVKNIEKEENAMDWLLTNSINAYAQMKKNNTQFKALKTVDEFMDILDYYENPTKYILKAEFEYDYDAWWDYYGDETHEDWNKLVTLEEVRESIIKKQPEAKISRHSAIQNAVLHAFELDYEHNKPMHDCKGYYVTTQNENYKEKDKICKFIVGLIKKDDTKQNLE